MSAPKPKNPIIEAQIERALEVYRLMRVPPEMLAKLAELIEEGLTTNPTAMAHIDRLTARPVAQSSDVRPKPGVEPARDRKAGGGSGS